MRIWGEVSLEGVPVDHGKVTLTPTGDTPGGSVAGVIKAGKYDIPSSEGPYAKGTYRVELSSLSQTDKSSPNIDDLGKRPLPVYEELIPRTYNANSKLSLTVSDEPSKNTD